MAVVGIDLGTTNTVIAAVRDGRAAALKDKLGKALLPSVVSFPPKGDPKVGYEAKDRRTIDPENTVFSVKRLIGRSWDSEHVQKAIERYPFELKEGPGKGVMVSARGNDHSLPEISALVLERAREIAETRLGTQVSDAVITVPANFNDLQRAATKVAGRTAGLQVLRILNEPTAAALAYGFGKKGRERIVVYDFGGGTFDVTLLDLSENVFEVLATAGDTFLGGDDLDRVISERMGEELLKKLKVDMHSDNLVREQLRAAAEKLKLDLSTRSMAKARIEDIGLDGGDFEFSMRRSEFEKLAEPMIKRTLEVCQEALDVAGVTSKELNQVLLVGGSTRIPLVRRRISSFFGKMPQSRINPDEVVAIGAAIQAAALESKMGASDVPGAPIPASNAPGGRRSAFPTSPGVGRKSGTTQTGLAGLRQTVSGTGSVRPSARPRTEGSVLSGLPKGASQPPGRPMQTTISGVGGSVPPAARLDGLPSGNTKPGPMKTLSGVGGSNKNPAIDKTLDGVGPSRPGPEPLEGPKTLAGLGEEKRGPRTLTGIGKPPAAEDLAAMRRKSAPPPLDEPTSTHLSPGAAPLPPNEPEPTFDDVTSVVDLSDELAHEQDAKAEALDRHTIPGAAAPPGEDAEQAKDGSVIFDLEELEASEPADELDDEDEKTQVLTSPTAVELDDADLVDGSIPAPQASTAAQALPLQDIAEIEELSGVHDFEEDEADLPALSSRAMMASEPDLTDLPALSEPPPPTGFEPSDDDESTDLPTLSQAPQPPRRTASGEMRLGLQQTMMGAPAAAEEQLGTLAQGLSGEDSASVEDYDPKTDADSSILDIPRTDDTIPKQAPPAETMLDGSGTTDDSTLGAAIGHALQSHPDINQQLEQEQQAINASARPPLLLDVTPLALGVEVVGGFVDTLIERNSPIPCERTRTFATARDDQTVVRVRVSQGDANHFADNTVLGEVELAGLAAGPRGSVKLDVSFALDESGMLQVSARDKRTGLTADARLKLIGIEGA